MDKNNILISVCIITYKRLKQLPILLESLADQTIFTTHTVEIIVVDNDLMGTAESIVKEFVVRYPGIAVTYEIEPIQGIPQARNHSVRFAKGKFIAFIDDDEKADRGWLEELYQCITNYGADAVFGPVEPILPGDCPGWLEKGKFYDRPHHGDGSVISIGRTSNAFVRKFWFERYENPFDPDLRFVGGSDSEFFARILKQDAKFCWAEHAVVYEFVGSERLKLRWLVMRAFRGGQGYAGLHTKDLEFGGKLVHFIYRLMLACFALGMTILSLPFGVHKSVWWLRKVFSNVGQMSVFLPFRYEEYRRSNYR